jgi:hypothetical protein
MWTYRSIICCVLARNNIKLWFIFFASIEEVRNIKIVLYRMDEFGSAGKY